jgi:hypothetical protein
VCKRRNRRRRHTGVVNTLRRPSLRLLAVAAAWLVGLAAVALWTPVVLVVCAPWLACVAWVTVRNGGADGFVPVGYAEAARRRLLTR